MKLFTIGDSISQGFMSGAAARTDLCFSTLLAKQFQIDTYQFPNWALGGLPLNIEIILRKLQESFGSEIDTLEWIAAFAKTIPEYLDVIENYYEKGNGAADQKYSADIDCFHNISIRGFNISDSWLITPEYCIEEIKKKKSSDGIYAVVDKSFLRTALRVLNPSLKQEHNTKTQLDWLKFHSDKPEGIENVIIWLGANNALGTILNLDIKFTDGAGIETTKTSDLLDLNLWHPKDFEVDYRILLNKTDAILGDKKTKVFLGTIPLITIAPLIKGVGESYTIHIDEQDLIYFKYYTYFPFDEKYAFKSGNNLNFAEVMHIDNCIREYNKTIKKLVEEHNQKTPNRYFIMDISKVLDQMAFKRNDANPTYQFPDYFQFQFPMPNTKYYHADTNGNLKQGGIFSLDGVHPSAIAHGIIAYEILKVMQNAGVQDANPNNLDWKAIFDSDLLYKSPITVMHEIYDNSKLIELILYITKKMTC